MWKLKKKACFKKKSPVPVIGTREPRPTRTVSVWPEKRVVLLRVIASRRGGDARPGSAWYCILFGSRGRRRDSIGHGFGSDDNPRAVGIPGTVVAFPPA